MLAITIDLNKGGHKHEREQEGVHRRVLKEDRKSWNVVIKIQY